MEVSESRAGKRVKTNEGGEKAAGVNSPYMQTIGSSFFLKNSVRFDLQMIQYIDLTGVEFMLVSSQFDFFLAVYLQRLHSVRHWASHRLVQGQDRVSLGPLPAGLHPAAGVQPAGQ